ncbi:phosphatase PAP2 family protein [Natrinema sp. DC36]|uniref:phosphatase PAP2 family protein n=1 Tax=Natrinema sp. DC36 TaxID=2878680 RepID=UPI001CF008A4|nr:phosphatase PAP2 family protein [Natrinema sp. DC36]
MYRGAGVLEAVRDLVPEWGAVLAAAVTQLGDGWFLLVLGIGASWTVAWRRTARRGRWLERDRRARQSDGPWFVAVIVGGLAVMTTLKHFFALPRPDLATLDPVVLPSSMQSLYLSIASAGGYGFPSGHAVGATVTYGLFALALDAGTRRLRLAVAGVIVAAVSLTRLVLGVHYPLDVVAGIVVGSGYLAVTWWLLERSPFDRTVTAFALALGLAGVAAVASGRADSAVAYVALAAGGLAGWTAANGVPMRVSTPVERHRVELLMAVVTLTAVGGFGVLGGRPRLVASAMLLGLLSALPAAVFPRLATDETTAP